MNQNQEMKMQLLKEFGVSDDKKSVDFCREAYKFLTENENPTPSLSPQCQVRTEPVAVDLGLPSGTLWCDRNVGAKSPEDSGAFVSWGNTDLHFPKDNNMDWGDDDEAFEDVYKFKYDEYKKTPGYNLEGDIDLEHDAARVNMGEPWIMPTKDDFQELFDNCIWTRKNINGVNGYLVTSKVNGNSIFFPAAGFGNGASLYDRGSNGYYWSSSLYSADYGYYLRFNSGGVDPQYSYNRYYGLSVRAVQKSPNK